VSEIVICTHRAAFTGCQDIDIYRGAAKPSNNTNSSSRSSSSDDHHRDSRIDIRNSYSGSTIDVIDMEWEVPRTSS
jgi:hypothetical protein